MFCRPDINMNLMDVIALVSVILAIFINTICHVHMHLVILILWTKVILQKYSFLEAELLQPFFLFCH
jgi:hypothetical protein